MGLFDRIRAAGRALFGREAPAPAAPSVDPGLPDLGIPHISGTKGQTTYGTANPQEVMRRVEEAANAGKRVSMVVHDKNGWHELYANRGGPNPRFHKPQPGMSGKEMLDRFQRGGVPGTEASRPEPTRAPRREEPRPAPAAPPTAAPAQEQKPGLGARIRGLFARLIGRGQEQEQPAPGPEPEAEPEEGEEEGEEWEEFEPDEGYDVGESEGGDEDETEEYDPGSVNGYQVIVYG